MQTSWATFFSRESPAIVWSTQASGVRDVSLVMHPERKKSEQGRWPVGFESWAEGKVVMKDKVFLSCKSVSRVTDFIMLILPQKDSGFGKAQIGKERP